LFQECDAFTCEPPQACHRCEAPRSEFFSGTVYRTKTATTRHAQIAEAAAGRGLQLQGMKQGPVVNWGQEPTRTHSAGPNSSHYEAFRAVCGAHLVYNAFWNVKHFCVHQMLMRDPMHQVDLGVIVHLVKAILRKYSDCVESILGIPGRAAARLKERFGLLFSKHKGHDGQR
jgi:hypothetical protein